MGEKGSAEKQKRVICLKVQEGRKKIRESCGRAICYQGGNNVPQPKPTRATSTNSLADS